MQRLVTALAICAAVACSASAHSRASEQAAPPAPIVGPVRTGHADVNLMGTWATGSAREPEAKQIVLHQECNYSPALWIIQQDGDTLRAWNSPARRAQGIATRETASSVVAEGWISGVDIALGTAEARYLLHYDSTSGHLRGTLNGAPFWAVRVKVVPPQGCIAVP